MHNVRIRSLFVFKGEGGVKYARTREINKLEKKMKKKKNNNNKKQTHMPSEYEYTHTSSCMAVVTTNFLSNSLIVVQRLSKFFIRSGK
jgi:predicted metal-dependent TIM-barrel fold hydrolase